MATPSEDLLLLAEEEAEQEDSMKVEDVVPMRVSIWGDEEEEGLKTQVTMFLHYSCVFHDFLTDW